MPCPGYSFRRLTLRSAPGTAQRASPYLLIWRWQACALERMWLLFLKEVKYVYL